MVNEEGTMVYLKVAQTGMVEETREDELEVKRKGGRGGRCLVWYSRRSNSRFALSKQRKSWMIVLFGKINCWTSS
jgi:hypothetical protein